MKTSVKTISLFVAAIMIICSFSACDWGVHPVPQDADRTSSEEVFSPHKFNPDDATADGIRIGMTADQVKSILGQPDEEQLVTHDTFIYGTYISMKYGQTWLSFYDINEKEDYTLGSIYTDSSDVKFVGGLHVGSSKADILTAFTHAEDPLPLYFGNVEECCGEYIYGSFNSSDFMIEKPKAAIQFAYINRYGEDYDHYYMMEYYYYNPLDWNKDEDEFTGDYYSIVFYMDSESNLATSIRISYELAM